MIRDLLTITVELLSIKCLGLMAEALTYNVDELLEISHLTSSIGHLSVNRRRKLWLNLLGRIDGLACP